MAAKYQLITELYRRTGVAVAKNPQAWQGFLSSACRNYKCRFDEQLLIYAPNAPMLSPLRSSKLGTGSSSVGSIRTARVLPYLTRKVAGILKYYFDVSDTHRGLLWQPPCSDMADG